jgi:hypothetical protein
MKNPHRITSTAAWIQVLDTSNSRRPGLATSRLLPLTASTPPGGYVVTARIFRLVGGASIRNYTPPRCVHFRGAAALLITVSHTLACRP